MTSIEGDWIHIVKKLVANGEFNQNKTLPKYCEANVCTFPIRKTQKLTNKVRVFRKFYLKATNRSLFLLFLFELFRERCLKFYPFPLLLASPIDAFPSLRHCTCPPALFLHTRQQNSGSNKMTPNPMLVNVYRGAESDRLFSRLFTSCVGATLAQP